MGATEYARRTRHDRIRRRAVSKPTRRVVLCIGKSCNAQGCADQFYARLQQELGFPHPFRHPPRIKWEIANCLDRCETAPNLVIYPEQRAYSHLDADTLETLIAQEIRPYLHKV